MAFSVTQEDILSVRADAAVLSVEIPLVVSDGKSNRRLADAGGETLRAALKRQRFLAVGSAAATEPCGLPFRQILFTASPRWLNGKINELVALRRCYQSIFALADELGLRRLTMPFFSTQYYHFPPEEAVHVALREAEKWSGEAVFTADTPELYAISQKPYRKPAIVEYVGYYRDYAVFLLDNGQYAQVDLRPENTEVLVSRYIEACYRTGTNPDQPPLPEAEIERLRRIYEDNGW